MYDLENEIEDEVSDPEYLDDQCPDCLRVFSSDEEFLAHICTKPYDKTIRTD